MPHPATSSSADAAATDVGRLSDRSSQPSLSREDNAADAVRQLEEAAAGMLAALAPLAPADDRGLAHRCSAALHHLFAAIDRAEHHLPVEELLKRLQLVRRGIGASPLAWRLQNWPRGYAGDFETIEMICRGDSVNLLQGGARWVEQWALHSPPVQQHRNKIARQAALMLDVLLRPSSAPPASVLSIACGPSRDVRQLLPLAHACRGAIWLNDFDLDALEFSRARLAGSALTCHYVPGNIFRVYKALAAEGPFDLVLAGGLFDYLTDRQATALIARVHDQLLKPGGRFFFTNIVGGHAYRSCMEYIVSWSLIERSECQIVALCESAGVPAAHVDVATDETGLAWLVTVAKP